MTVTPPPSSNGTSRPNRADSRFFCNRARTASLVLGLVAVVALVAGFILAELSASGAPTSSQTAVVRWVILAARKRDELRVQAAHLGAVADQLDHALGCPSQNVFECEHFRSALREALPVGAESES